MLEAQSVLRTQGPPCPLSVQVLPAPQTPVQQSASTLQVVPAPVPTGTQEQTFMTQWLLRQSPPRAHAIPGAVSWQVLAMVPAQLPEQQSLSKEQVSPCPRHKQVLEPQLPDAHWAPAVQLPPVATPSQAVPMHEPEQHSGVGSAALQRAPRARQAQIIIMGHDPVEH
jgi:hypothetical protein